MAGCGNHGCRIEKPTGMGTNGRCNCCVECKGRGSVDDELSGQPLICGHCDGKGRR